MLLLDFAKEFKSSLGIILSVSRTAEIETKDGTEIEILQEPTLSKNPITVPAT